MTDTTNFTTFANANGLYGTARDFAEHLVDGLVEDARHCRYKRDTDGTRRDFFVYDAWGSDYSLVVEMLGSSFDGDLDDVSDDDDAKVKQVVMSCLATLQSEEAYELEQWELRHPLVEVQNSGKVVRYL